MLKRGLGKTVVMNIFSIKDRSRGSGVRAGIMLAVACGCLAGDPRPVSAGCGDVSGENTGLGYLTAPSLSPGHILRPSSIFVLPTPGAKGAERLDFDFHWGNVWNYTPDKFMIDGEWLRSSLRYSYALKETVSVGVAVPVVGRMGGFTDPAIETFHKSFGLGDGGQKDFPANQSRIAFNTSGATNVVAEGDSWGLGDLSVFGTAQLTPGTHVWPAVTVQAELFFPTGDQDQLRGMGSPAIALSSAASKRLGASPFISFLGLGFQYCDSEDLSVIEFHNEQYSGLVGLEYQYSRTFCLLVQYLISSPVATDYYAFSESCHEVSAGIKWRVENGSSFELAVVENIAVFKNSADIGLHLAYGRNL